MLHQLSLRESVSCQQLVVNQKPVKLLGPHLCIPLCWKEGNLVVPEKFHSLLSYSFTVYNNNVKQRTTLFLCLNVEFMEKITLPLCTLSPIVHVV